MYLNLKTYNIDALSNFRWQFISEGNDLGFGVFCRTADVRQRAGEMVEVYPSQRVNCHMVPEEDSIVCDKVGTCEWFSPKLSRILSELEQTLGLW